MKKGISPLIATVLIIGFTVALAAVIMTWGQSFIKGMQETTTETTDVALTCANEVKIDVQRACNSTSTGATDTDTVEVVIANDGTRAISYYTVRLYETASTIHVYSSKDDENLDTKGITAGIDSFGIITNKITTADNGAGIPALTGIAGDIKAVEIIPTIEVKGIEHTCAASADTFGDVTGTSIVSC